MKRLLVVGVLAFVLSVALWPGSPPVTAKEDAARGLALYQKHCAICHGPEGRGDGPAAYLLNPKPRDLTAGEFRLITTTNSVPTDDDLLRVLANGMPGSSMPPWDRLAEADQRLIVGTIKEFWRKALLAQYRSEGLEADEIREYLAEDITPGPSVSLTGAGEPTLAQIARGRVVYTQACASCHGPEGRGESTQQLLDSRGYPAPARDFTKGIFKGGHEAEQIFSRLRAGMRGTAMPTFPKESLSDDEAWAVVHYIRTLFPPMAQDRQRQSTKRIPIRRVEGLPADDGAWWKVGEPAYIALMPLWWRDERTEAVLVHAVHDGKTLALRVVWEDPQEDKGILRPNTFQDGAAVQLSWDKDPPFFGMGDPESAVLIWSWKASWQEDKENFQDVESIYPHLNLDTYFPVQKNLKAGDRPARDAVGAAHHDPGYLSGWGAGNPMSDPTRPSAVEVARAKGQGSLTTQERAAQTVKGKAVWDRGVWTLILKSEMAPERCRDLWIAFAVWNGAEKDRNGQKSVSIWHHLELE